MILSETWTQVTLDVGLFYRTLSLASEWVRRCKNSFYCSYLKPYSNILFLNQDTLVKRDSSLVNKEFWLPQGYENALYQWLLIATGVCCMFEMVITLKLTQVKIEMS